MGKMSKAEKKANNKRIMDKKTRLIISVFIRKRNGNKTKMERGREG